MMPAAHRRLPAGSPGRTAILALLVIVAAKCVPTAFARDDQWLRLPRPLSFQGDGDAGGSGTLGETPAQPQDRAQLAEQSYAEALAFYVQGKKETESTQTWLRTCEEKFEGIIIDFPETDGALAALYCRSLCQSRQKRFEIAIEGLEEFRAHASEKVPPVRGLLLLADCYSQLRAWDKAVAIREQLLAGPGAANDTADALYALGRDLRDLGRLDAAKTAWSRLQNEFPDSKGAELAAARAHTLAPPSARLQPLRAKLLRELQLISAERGDAEVAASAAERAEAILNEIGEIHAPEAEQYLLKVFNAEPAAARQYVVKPLLAVASPGTIHTILRQIVRLDPILQRDFLDHTQPFHLEGLTIKKQFAPWIASDADPISRAAALRLLGRTGTLEAANLLLDCLERTEAIDISHLERTGTRPVVQALRDLRRKDSLARLIEVLRDEKESMLRRVAAASALGGSRHPEGAAALGEIVAKMNGATLTLAALDSLKRRRAVSAAEAVLRGLVLRLDHPQVRQAALDTLVQLDALLPSDSLLALGSVSELGFRRAWIGLLGKHAHRDECLRRLILALADPAWQVRELVALMFASIRRIEVIDALVERLAVEEPALASTICASLVALTGDNVGTDPVLWREYWRMARPKWQAIEEEARAGAGYVRGKSQRTAVFYGLEVTGKTVVFLVDGSASMKTPLTVSEEKGGEATVERMALAREEIAGALSKLSPEVDFNVVIFQSEPRPLWPAPQKATAQNVEQAIEFARKTEPAGATNIFDSLEFAMKTGDVETIFLLSDGEPSAGKIVAPEQILDAMMRMNRVRKVVIHAIALGEESPFLARLARLNFGRFVHAGKAAAAPGPSR